MLENLAASRPEIRALTSLRGVAALAVVTQHFSATAQQHAAVTLPSIPPHGYMAVDLFFVLSGFIMSYTYLDGFAHRGISAFGPFLARRVARIVPLNLFVLGVFVLLGAVSIAVTGKNLIYPSCNLALDLLANMLMLQGLGFGVNMNGPSWSISTEFAAYLAFPLFVAAIGLSRPRIAVAAVAVLAAVLIAAVLPQPRLGMGDMTVAFRVLRTFAGFGFGMAIFRLFQLAPVRAFMARDAAAWTAIAASAAGLLMRLDLFAALTFPPLILALACNRGGPARLMSMPALHGLGLVSFSLYLIHQPFRTVELALLQHIHPAPLELVPALGFVLAGSATVLPFAIVAYLGVERPGRVAVSRLLRARPKLLRAS